MQYNKLLTPPPHPIFIKALRIFNKLIYSGNNIQSFINELHTHFCFQSSELYCEPPCVLFYSLYTCLTCPCTYIFIYLSLPLVSPTHQSKQPQRLSTSCDCVLNSFCNNGGTYLGRTISSSVFTEILTRYDLEFGYIFGYSSKFACGKYNIQEVVDVKLNQCF